MKRNEREKSQKQSEKITKKKKKLKQKKRKVKKPSMEHKECTTDNVFCFLTYSYRPFQSLKQQQHQQATKTQ